MNIGKKLVLTITVTLAIVFLGLAALNSVGIKNNNSKIVSSILMLMKEDNKATIQHLEANTRSVASELKHANDATRQIIVDLYFDTLISAIANQIFQMIEVFDFDSPKATIEKLLAENPTITWVKLTTAENPGEGDIMTFGQHADVNERLSFSKVIAGDYAYLKVDMQVSLKELPALAEIAAIFKKINHNNQQQTSNFTATSQQSLSSASEYAVQIGEQGKQSLITTSAILMLVALVIVCVVLTLFVQKLVSRPLEQTVGMLEELENGHIGQRLNLQRSDEIGRMAGAMDRFADSLQKEIVKPLQQLAQGDLTFDARPRDERDVLRSALKQLGGDLNEMIAQILTTGEEINHGSIQISDSSQTLSQGATESAASLEEITASMTELASQTKLNAENATQANQLVGNARNAAQKGNEQMQEMVTAMGAINESGQNISKIIKVIDEIAFQTNLLALNAAVEAARAGQHGKGFAVVAEEVRNLAARSAQAARETAELIEGSVEKAQQGATVADLTADSLAEIVKEIGKVADLVGEIEAASNEQSQGIDQVNVGLGQIDKVTQQNTANAEESAAAAEELSSQAEQLRHMLAGFKLSEQKAAIAVPPAQNTIKALPTPSSGSLSDTYSTNGQDASKVIALDNSEFGKY